MSQSEDEIKFKNSDLKVFIATVPAGGCFVSDEALNEISRETVIQIKKMIIIVFGNH